MSLKTIGSERWYALCERLGVDIHLARDHFNQMRTNYTDSGRAYHTLEHINMVVGMLEQFRSRISNFDVLELSAWMHDFIMYFHRRPRGFPGNETLSAVANDLFLMQCGKSYDCRIVSYNQIMVTTHEEDRARTYDEMLLADCDWSPLGLPWEGYMDNRAKIRHEYRHVSDTDFQNARLAWVAKSCRRKSHFYLPEFKEKYDEQAQANLTRELAEFRTL